MPRKLWAPREDEAQLFSESYLDESSQNGKHRFFVLGGIMFPIIYSDMFEAAITEARSRRLRQVRSNGFITEIGWKFVGNGDFDEYKDLVDAYFNFKGAMSGVNDYKFHCSVLDTTAQGRRYSGGQRGEDSFNREIFFLTERIARRYPQRLFHIYPAKRSTIRPASHMSELAGMVNGRLFNNGDKRIFPIRRLAFRENAKVQALQISDLFIGAIAYRINRHYDEPNANKDKRRLADYILKRGHILAMINSKRLKSKTWGDFHLYLRRHKS